MTNLVEQLFGKDALKSAHEAEYLDRTDAEWFAKCPHAASLMKKHERELNNYENDSSNSR